MPTPLDYQPKLVGSIFRQCWAQVVRHDGELGYLLPEHPRVADRIEFAKSFILLVLLEGQLLTGHCHLPANLVEKQPSHAHTRTLRELNVTLFAVPRAGDALYNRKGIDIGQFVVFDAANCFRSKPLPSTRQQHED